MDEEVTKYLLLARFGTLNLTKESKPIRTISLVAKSLGFPFSKTQFLLKKAIKNAYIEDANQVNYGELERPFHEI